MTSVQQQNETVTATVNGTLTANANVNFTAALVSVVNSTITVNPNILLADGTTTTVITVTARNGGGAPVIAAPVTMSATGIANTFGTPSGSTNGSGVFTTTLASTQAASKVVTATVSGTALNANVTFTPGAPVSVTTTLVASPNTVTADGASTSTLTVAVKDAHSNAVSGQAVALTASGTNNTWSPVTPSGTSDSSGLFTATLASTKEQIETITATINGNYNETTTVSFVAGAVSAATSTFGASPTTTIADGTSVITLTAVFRDAQGNPEPNQTVNLTAPGGVSNIFTPSTGTTDATGTFIATLKSTVAQNENVIATVGTTNETVNVTFVAGTPSNTTSTLVLNPASVSTNGNTTTITVTVKDAHGNPVGNQSVALSGSGTANTFNPQTGNTLVTGVFTATLSSTVAQNENVIATVVAMNLSAPIIFTASSPNSLNSTFTVSPTTLVADGVTQTTLTVTVKDAQGNPVPSQAVTFSGSGGAADTFSATSGSTAANGIISVTLESTLAEVDHLTASFAGVTKNANVTFTSGAPDPVETTFTASPNTLAVNTNTTLSVLVKDAYGNPVANQNVTLSSTGSNNSFSTLSGTTDATGAFTATLTSTKAESKTVTATVGSLTPHANVTFTPGVPSNTTSSMTAVPTSVTANNANVTTITVTVEDIYGNLVSNQAVSLAASGTNSTWSPTNGSSSTTTAGVWSTTLASPTAQSETITATIGSFQLSANVTFVTGAPSSSTSTLGASPSSAPDDGSSAVTLTVTVRDASSNQVNGQVVTFTSSGTGYTFSGTTCVTVSGTCFVTLKSTVAQVVTVTATFAGITKTTPVSFTLGAPNSSTSTFVVNPTSLTVSGTSNLTVTVKDATGNAIPSQTVSLTGTGTNTFTPTSGPKNSNGVFTATVTSTVAQAETLTATVGSVNLNANITFTVASPNTTTSIFTASPSSLTANGSATSTLSLTLKDAYGNAIPSAGVTFAYAGSSYTLSPSSTCTTNSSGACSATLSSTLAQAKNASVTFSSNTMLAAVTFVAGPAASATSTFVASPSSAPDDGATTIALQVTVNDANNNPVSGQAVTFSTTASAYTRVSEVLCNAVNRRSQGHRYPVVHH